MTKTTKSKGNFYSFRIGCDTCGIWDNEIIDVKRILQSCILDIEGLWYPHLFRIKDNTGCYIWEEGCVMPIAIIKELVKELRGPVHFAIDNFPNKEDLSPMDIAKILYDHGLDKCFIEESYFETGTRWYNGSVRSCRIKEFVE